MPKMKTRRGAAKRVRVTQSGKIKFKKAMGRHILTGKSPGNKRRIGAAGYMSPGDRAKTARCLPYIQKGL
ncbi:MAG: 50S ribosomal protein L35 [Pseudomonadota bacterium]